MAIISKFYFKINGNWEYQGETDETSWSVATLDLQYSNTYQWKINTYDTESQLTAYGDIWSLTIESPPPPAEIPERPSDFSEDSVWGYNPDTEQYEWGTLDLAASGGGRYRQQLVVIGHQTIYYGEL